MTPPSTSTLLFLSPFAFGCGHRSTLLTFFRLLSAADSIRVGRRPADEVPSADPAAWVSHGCTLSLASATKMASETTRKVAARRKTSRQADNVC